MAAGYTVDNISVSPLPFAPTDTITIKYRVRNTGTVNMTKFGATLRYLDGSTYTWFVPLESGGALKAGKSVTKTQTIDLSEFVDSTLRTTLFGNHTRAITVYLSVNANYNNALDLRHFELGTMINIWAQPKFLSPSIRRCLSNGTYDDEGTYARLWTGYIHWYNSTYAAYFGFSMKVYYAQGRAATTSDSYIEVTGLQNSGTIFAILSNQITFSTGYDYGFLITYGDQYEMAQASITMFALAANVHLSGTGFGVALGHFSNSSANNPLFECGYSAVFEDDVTVPATGLLKVVEASDSVNVSTSNNNVDKTVAVTPGTGWTPIGIVGFTANNSFCSIYKCYLSSNGAEFSLRYSGTSSGYSLALKAYVLCIHTG